MALLQYTYLQLLDLLTTLAFLPHGVEEGNLLVRFVLERSSSDLAGLLLVKLAAMGLGAAAWLSGRRRLLGRANVFFAVVVAWNLLALVVAKAAAV
jgi:hypothetical protein